MCVRFEDKIRSEGLTFKLLERRLNINLETFKGEDDQIIGLSMGGMLA